MKNKIKDFYRSLRYFIISCKNLIYYFKVVWRDRDWDHAYLEDLMRAKLKKWYKRYSNVQKLPLPYKGVEKDLQAMRICIEILDRRDNMFYINTWHNNPLQRKVKYDFTPTIVNGKEMFEMNSIGLTEEEELKNSELHSKAYKCEQRDWRNLCRIFEKYFDKWWD